MTAETIAGAQAALARAAALTRDDDGASRRRGAALDRERRDVPRQPPGVAPHGDRRMGDPAAAEQARIEAAALGDGEPAFAIPGPASA